MQWKYTKSPFMAYYEYLALACHPPATCPAATMPTSRQSLCVWASGRISLQVTLRLFVRLLAHIMIKLSRVPRRVVGCRCGSRYVEGWWGFPYLKSFVVSWFLGLWFLGFLVVCLVSSE